MSASGSRRDSQRRRGQALAEFALVMPLFFLLVFSIIEFGRFIYTYEIVNNAVREGARYAIVHGSASECPSGPMPDTADGQPVTNPCDPTGAKIQAIVQQYAIGVPASSLTVNPPVWEPDNNARGSTVTVSAVDSFSTLVPFVPLPTITIPGESTLVINH